MSQKYLGYPKLIGYVAGALVLRRPDWRLRQSINAMVHRAILLPRPREAPLRVT